MTDFTHLMFWVLVGHFVGDYLLQSKQKALTKSVPGWTGLAACLLHCGWYTLAVCTAACLAMGNFWTLEPSSKWWMMLMVFATHFPIDRWSLADKWLKMIHGRQLDEVFKEATSTSNVPSVAWQGTEYLLADKTNVANVATRQAFTALVYAVVDNTLHFLLMAAGFAALLYWGVLP